MDRQSTEFLRAWACLAVISIHATGGAEANFHRDQAFLSLDFLAVVLNQAARFCVPIFVLLSGFGLAQKFRRPLNAAELGQFARKRFLRIVLPFVVWTVAILHLHGTLVWNGPILDSLVQNGQRFLPYLYRQGADYHFYFFIIIIQCYLAFPILLYVIQSRFATGFLFFLVVLTALFASPSHLAFQALGIARPGFFSAFLLYWVVYFYAGIYLARSGIRASLAGWSYWPWALFATFALVLFDYVWRSRSAPDPGHYNHFTRISILAYSLVFIVFYRGQLGQRARWPGLAFWPAFQRYWLQFAALSFTIYIIHTWILRLGNWIWPEYYFTLPFVVLCAYGLAWTLDRLIPDRRGLHYVRLALGLPAT